MKRYMNECGDAATLTPEDIETLKAIIAKIDSVIAAKEPECDDESEDEGDEPIEADTPEIEDTDGEDEAKPEVGPDEYVGDGPNDGIDFNDPVVLPSMEDLPDVDEEDPDETAYY